MLGISVEYDMGDERFVTSDGRAFQTLERAEIHQAALDGQLSSPGRPLGLSQVSGIQITYLHSEGFVTGDVVDGDAELVQDAATSRLLWRMTPATLEALQLLVPSVRAGKVRNLRQAREAGRTMVEGVVKPNARRPAPTREPRVTLQPLVDRAKGLVITIAGLDAPTDGQVSEITKSVAAIQAERDALVEQLAELDEHLAIGRAVILAHSDPRSV